MVSSGLVQHVGSGLRFVYPFQGDNVLWEVQDSLGGNRWGCQVINGAFGGHEYESIYVGNSAEFHEDHLRACIALDSQLVRVAVCRDRMRANLENQICEES